MKTQTNRMIHEVLRNLPYGLYAVGVRGKEDGGLNALVASWVTQCSFDPPLLLVAIRKGTRSCDLLRQGQAFSVNLIDKNERRLARELVKPAHRVGDKLGAVSHFEDNTGAPILRKAFGYLECRVCQIFEPGDHALVVGEVVNAGWHGTGEPLLCSHLRWRYGG